MDLDEAYARWGAGLYRYAMALTGSPQDAEDAVQEVFMRFAGLGKAPENPQGYLLAAVRHEAWDRVNRARRQRAALREGAPLLVPREGGDPGLSDLAARASEALKSLPAEQREAVALHLFEGLGFREIGELCGIPQDTAASRYRYGIAKLKEALGDA